MSRCSHSAQTVGGSPSRGRPIRRGHQEYLASWLRNLESLCSERDTVARRSGCSPAPRTAQSGIAVLGAPRLAGSPGQSSGAAHRTGRNTTQSLGRPQIRYVGGISVAVESRRGSKVRILGGDQLGSENAVGAPHSASLVQELQVQCFTCPAYMYFNY